MGTVNTTVQVHRPTHRDVRVGFAGGSPELSVLWRGDNGAERRAVALGAVPADIAKITTFVVNYSPELRPILTAGRGDFFDDEPSASTLIGVQSLATPQLLVEVEAIVALE